MSKGIKTEWTPQMLSILETEFPTTLNKILTVKLGVSERVLVRKAREIGLEKAKDFRKINAKEISLRIQHAQKLSPHTAWRNFCFKKGSDAGKETQFKKGVSTEMRFGKERAKEIYRKIQVSRSETWKKEKAREIWGLPRKTKFRIRKQSNAKIQQRYYLKQHGYIIDEHLAIAYWDINTNRRKRIEETSRFFKFAQKKEA